MSKGRWVVMLVATAVTALVVGAGDPTHSSWPVLFLFFFGVALMVRAIWHTAMIAADTLHPAPHRERRNGRRNRTGSVRERLTWSYLHV